MKARIDIRNAAAAERIRAQAAELAEKTFKEEGRRIARQEAMKELHRVEREYAADFDTIVLWVLHDRFGFGRKRLVQFQQQYKALQTEILKKYEFGTPQKDVAWYARRELAKIGVVIDETGGNEDGV